MTVSSNKILQKYDHPPSHYVMTLFSAQNLSDSNFSEAANCPKTSSPHLSCRTSRCPSADQSANWAIIVSLTSSCGCSTRGCSGSACPYHKTLPANRPCITRPSTRSLPDGRMMARSGRRLWPVCGISRARSSSISACSMATGPTRWRKRGRWHWLLGPQTSDGGESHRHHRQSWLRLSAGPRGSGQ